MLISDGQLSNTDTAGKEALTVSSLSEVRPGRALDGRTGVFFTNAPRHLLHIRMSAKLSSDLIQVQTQNSAMT